MSIAGTVNKLQTAQDRAGSRRHHRAEGSGRTPEFSRSLLRAWGTSYCHGVWLANFGRESLQGAEAQSEGAQILRSSS